MGERPIDIAATEIAARVREQPELAKALVRQISADPDLIATLWAEVVLSSTGLDWFAAYIEEMDAAAVRPRSAALALFPNIALASKQDDFAPRFRRLWARVHRRRRPLLPRHHDPAEPGR